MNTGNNLPIQTTNNHQQVPVAQAGLETLPAPESVTDKPSSLKKKFIIIALIGLFFLILATLALAIFYFLKPRQSASLSWNGLQPGVSSREEVITKLGQPTKVEELPFSTALIYPSDFEIFPNVIVLDENDKVKSIFIQVPIAEEVKLSEWIEEYDKPEKEMWNTISAETKTYLFPKKGMVVVASEPADSVNAIHYFIPMTLENYLETWGQNLFEKNPYTM